MIFPKPYSGTSELLFLVEKKEAAGLGLGGVWMGRPTGKKWTAFENCARKKKAGFWKFTDFIAGQALSGISDRFKIITGSLVTLEK